MDAARRAQDPTDEGLLSVSSQNRPAVKRRSAQIRPATSSRMAALEPEFGPASVSSEVLRLTFARSPSGITVSARDGRRLGVNDAYCRMRGYDQPERSEELAREQALTELEQAIGDREQPIAADAGTIRRAMARAEAAEVRAQAGHPSEAG